MCDDLLLAGEEEANELNGNGNGKGKKKQMTTKPRPRVIGAFDHPILPMPPVSFFFLSMLWCLVFGARRMVPEA